MRGSTRGARSVIGLLFAVAGMPVLAIILRALEIARGTSPLPSPRSDSAFFFFVGLIAFFGGAYLIGRRVARLFRRSQVRFFRSYRHR